MVGLLALNVAAPASWRAGSTVSLSFHCLALLPFACLLFKSIRAVHHVMFFGDADLAAHCIEKRHVDLQAFSSNVVDFSDCLKKTSKFGLLICAWWCAYEMRAIGRLAWIMAVSTQSAVSIAFQSSQNVWVSPDQRQSDTHGRRFLAQSAMHGAGILVAVACMAIGRSSDADSEGDQDHDIDFTSLGFDSLSYADLILVLWAAATLAVAQRVVLCGVRWKPAWKTDGATRRPAGVLRQNSCYFEWTLLPFIPKIESHMLCSSCVIALTIIAHPPRIRRLLGAVARSRYN